MDTVHHGYSCAREIGVIIIIIIIHNNFLNHTCLNEVGIIIIIIIVIVDSDLLNNTSWIRLYERGRHHHHHHHHHTLIVILYSSQREIKVVVRAHTLRHNQKLSCTYIATE